MPAAFSAPYDDDQHLSGASTSPVGGGKKPGVNRDAATGFDSDDQLVTIDLNEIDSPHYSPSEAMDEWMRSQGELLRQFADGRQQVASGDLRNSAIDGLGMLLGNGENPGALHGVLESSSALFDEPHLDKNPDEMAAELFHAAQATRTLRITVEALSSVGENQTRDMDRLSQRLAEAAGTIAGGARVLDRDRPEHKLERAELKRRVDAAAREAREVLSTLRDNDFSEIVAEEGGPHGVALSASELEAAHNALWLPRWQQEILAHELVVPQSEELSSLWSQGQRRLVDNLHELHEAAGGPENAVKQSRLARRIYEIAHTLRAFDTENATGLHDFLEAYDQAEASDDSDRAVLAAVQQKLSGDVIDACQTFPRRWAARLAAEREGQERHYPRKPLWGEHRWSDSPVLPEEETIPGTEFLLLLKSSLEHSMERYDLLTPQELTQFAKRVADVREKIMPAMEDVLGGRPDLTRVTFAVETAPDISRERFIRLFGDLDPYSPEMAAAMFDVDYLHQQMDFMDLKRNGDPEAFFNRYALARSWSQDSSAPRPRITQVADRMALGQSDSHHAKNFAHELRHYLDALAIMGGETTLSESGRPRGEIDLKNIASCIDYLKSAFTSEAKADRFGSRVILKAGRRGDLDKREVLEELAWYANAKARVRAQWQARRDEALSALRADTPDELAELRARVEEELDREQAPLRRYVDGPAVHNIATLGLNARQAEQFQDAILSDPQNLTQRSGEHPRAWALRVDQTRSRSHYPKAA